MPCHASIRLNVNAVSNADMQVMKGGQIQASSLDHLVGWPRSHVVVATKGYVLVVCESEAQRLVMEHLMLTNV